MDLFSAALTGAYNLFNTDMTFYGFTFSYWDVFLWSLIVIVVGTLIVRFLWN